MQSQKSNLKLEYESRPGISKAGVKIKQATIASIEKPIFSGNEFAELIIAQIESASTEICISTYIFGKDSFGKMILDKLMQKAEAGVEVRLLVDGFGSLDWLEQNSKFEHAENMEIRIFHPYPKIFAKTAVLDWNWLSRFVDSISLANRRNHQKLFIADDNCLIVGSRNFHQEALEWRETSLISKTELVAIGKSIFDYTWNLSWNPDEKRLKRFAERFKARRRGLDLEKGDLLTNHTRRLRKVRNKRITELMRNCHSRLWITTPYFFPPGQVMRAFERLSKKEVEVILLLPSNSDVWISKLMAKLYYRKMLKLGVKIFEYEGAILHAKSMICDDLAVIGSGNLNQRSFRRDLEVDCSVDNQSCVEACAEQFQLDLKQAQPQTLNSGLTWLQWVLVKILSLLLPNSF